MMGSTRLPSAKSSVLPLAAALSALSAALLARAVHGQIPACGLDSSYYEAAADAFPVDVTATAGNPFKGLATSPAWHSSLPYRTNIPASLEFHFLSLASVMDGPASFTFAAGLEPALIVRDRPALDSNLLDRARHERPPPRRRVLCGVHTTRLLIKLN